MKRKATAVWKGSGKEGSGHLTTETKVLNNTKYTYKSRFEDGKETNPEELIAAAHAGCFLMKLSFVLGEAGFTPEEMTAECSIAIEQGVISGSHIVLKARVPNISKDEFDKCANDAKDNCPVSKLLSTKTMLEASLV